MQGPCLAAVGRTQLEMSWAGPTPAVVWTSMMTCRPSFAADFSRYAMSVFGSTAAMSRAASAPIARACAPCTPVSEHYISIPFTLAYRACSNAQVWRLCANTLQRPHARLKMSNEHNQGLIMCMCIQLNPRMKWSGAARWAVP